MPLPNILCYSIINKHIFTLIYIQQNAYTDLFNNPKSIYNTNKLPMRQANQLIILKIFLRNNVLKECSSMNSNTCMYNK